MSAKLLTVIITMRAATHYDMVSRLRYRLLDTSVPDTVAFLVVDDGSDAAAAIRTTCDELGFSYVRHESGKKHFCAPSARNVGAQSASTRFIMHEDVDLFPYPGFYGDILEEIRVNGLNEHSNRFLTVPCCYLSEQATELAMAGEISKSDILQSHLLGTGMVTTYLPASSVIVVDRYYFLSIGGYNEKFNGWGLEDLEYAYRLTQRADQFETPLDPSHLVEGGYANYSAYRGWRSQFRLHGDLLARKGIVIFHAHHPKDTDWRNLDAHGKNKALFKAETARFDLDRDSLPSLTDPQCGRSLIFGHGTFAYNPALLPLWGSLEVKGYQAFADMDIVDYCRVNGISRVIFTNPYASEQRLRVYRQVRAANIPFVVVERGALPDSMFIDDTGFCCESTRYRREHWPSELDADRLARVTDYIADQTSGGFALERQGERMGKRAALHSLGIPDTKKVLFVPFQSRSDTTVNFFAGPIGSFDNFVSLVREVTTRVPKDWTVIFKKHPLSSVKEEVPGAIDVGDMHINDALEIADYVLLMNSGVGVLSVLFGKPVIHTAQAFYSDEGLNRSASTADEVLALLAQGFAVDGDARFRFISYLLEDFYSFGKFTVKERRHTENAMLTITERIDYYRVNFLGRRLLDLPGSPKVANPQAPIYDIFREWIKRSAVWPPAVAKPLAFYRRPLVPIVRPFVIGKGSKKDVEKFNADPAGFFANLTNPWYRAAGRILFPTGRG
ncbi:MULTISPECIES: galactosyltransferase-related protein [Alphaproteobacteria]|uniref:Glycosyltransferase 2-like prokaryotic type domain-containing protein n=2 Tax=Alphaproteobacteria TaxID=28211 RepID=A0A512HE95_9HYPH|nr:MULTISPECIES: galactosyltransferase-related protein [Alphaproteobacteria]GEO83778.1 hypothetical protein RNA01_07100 [Ciceribacter naphthalenivorans]GLR24070.1 hypothetical protein GCM10007920_38640 [Ciceribacter naphthalenivorans]GLT06926.1 hypothetical protein GCM10007926_38640 [Sphingomonas psychrolutea]